MLPACSPPYVMQEDAGETVTRHFLQGGTERFQTLGHPERNGGDNLVNPGEVKGLYISTEAYGLQ